MNRIAVIGAGVSGLSIARLLHNDADVTVFEKDNQPGGLIKCERVDGNLYHVVGGHVFNSKNMSVLNWFWSFFSREKEFISATRNSVIHLDRFVQYPIENNIYQLPENLARDIISDLLSINRSSYPVYNNLEDFLLKSFGETLYNLYFKPYNEKIWKQDLKKVPLSWLQGKLPMPTIEEIFENNILRKEEIEMVHSSFYYPRTDGSQYIANKLAEGLNINYNCTIDSIQYIADDKSWIINDERFDTIIYTGNVKELIPNLDTPFCSDNLSNKINSLESHGTTSVLCEIGANPYSWVYLPDENCDAHRIICTGNFAESNNRPGITTATIEFTDLVSKVQILENLKKLPFSPRYITHQYTEYTYPIQNIETRRVISDLKNVAEPYQLYLIGRFAEWEYYNMDTAMAAAMDLANKILLRQ